MKGLMRRFLSILLIAVFGFTTFGSLAESSHTSQLPVCCRRHGMHHCSGMDGDATARIVAASSGSTATIGALSRCPHFPNALHARLATVFATVAQDVVPVSLQSAERVYGFSASYTDSSSSGAHAVRGPPAVVLA